MQRKLIASAAAAAIAVMAAQAHAQQPAAATAPAPTAASAPALPGICVVSIDRAAETSAAGKAAAESLRKISTDTNTELNGQAQQLQAAKTKFETDAKAYNARYDKLSEDQAKALATSTQTEAQALQKTQQGLIQQEQQLGQLIQIRQREVEATQAKTMNTIAQAMNTPIQQVFQARGCSVLFHMESVALASPAMDITADVVTRLDGVLKPFAVQREVLPQQAAAPAGAAAPAVRPATAAPARPAAGAAPARRK